MKGKLTNPKVLLVDDEQAITSNLAPFLERSGFSVAVANDGQETLHQVSDFGPALIVLDVLMPRMDGREVLRRLRQADNWTPVILLTQVGEATERAMALEEGADDFSICAWTLAVWLWCSALRFLFWRRWVWCFGSGRQDPARRE